MNRFVLTILACFVFLATAATGPGQDAKKPTKPALPSFQGKVASLAGALKKQKVELDDDAAPHWLVLFTEDGRVLPLVKDDGSRMFYKDTRLLNRTMRLTGKLVPGSELLVVTAVHSVVDGKLHEVYYWCDHCLLRADEAGPCRCCGRETRLIEEPVK